MNTAPCKTEEFQPVRDRVSVALAAFKTGDYATSRRLLAPNLGVSECADPVTKVTCPKCLGASTNCPWCRYTGLVTEEIARQFEDGAALEAARGDVNVWKRAEQLGIPGTVLKDLERLGGVRCGISVADVWARMADRGIKAAGGSH